MASLSFCWWGGASLISFFPFAGVQYSSASIQRQKTYNIRPGIFAPWRPKVRPEIHPFTPWRPFSSHFKFRVSRDSKGKYESKPVPVVFLNYIFFAWMKWSVRFLCICTQPCPGNTSVHWKSLKCGRDEFSQGWSVGHATEAGVTPNIGPRDSWPQQIKSLTEDVIQIVSKAIHPICVFNNLGHVSHEFFQDCHGFAISFWQWSLHFHSATWRDLSATFRGVLGAVPANHRSHRAHRFREFWERDIGRHRKVWCRGGLGYFGIMVGRRLLYNPDFSDAGMMGFLPLTFNDHFLLWQQTIHHAGLTWWDLPWCVKIIHLALRTKSTTCSIVGCM